MFTPEQLEKIRLLGREIDVFIDVGSHGLFVAEEDRAQFVRGFDASFGTANGFWIYPPQRWERTRWLIPHHRQNHDMLKKVYLDGGRSCELYLSPLNNPGAEITFLCNGLMLNDPEGDASEHLRRAVDMLYRPETEAQRERIAAIFDGAEELFFRCWHPQRDRSLPEALSDGVENVFVWSKAHPDSACPGEFFLERLFGVGPGFPCYLALHFDADGRARYRDGMRELLALCEQAIDAQPCERLERVRAGILSVLADIDEAAKALRDKP